jgi:small subunit ribosomal protein S18
MNSLIKDKKLKLFSLTKKRTNWNQSLSLNKEIKLEKKIKRSLQYILLLKKFDNIIEYKNIKLLKAFLNKFGKIRPRRKTRIPLQQQRSLAKSIKKARSFGLIPFSCDLKE